MLQGHSIGKVEAIGLENQDCFPENDMVVPCRALIILYKYGSLNLCCP